MIINPFTLLSSSNFKISTDYISNSYYYLNEKCIVAFMTGYDNNYSTIIAPEEIIKNNYSIQLIYNGMSFGNISKDNNVVKIAKYSSSMNFIVVQLISE